MQEEVSLARFTEELRIMFHDASLMDVEKTKWLMNMKRKIDEHDDNGDL